MMRQRIELLVAAAAAGIAAGCVDPQLQSAPLTVTVPASSGSPLVVEPTATATPRDDRGKYSCKQDDPEKHACKGQNECKGQGGCKTDTNACKGQNACKAQGGCKA